MATVRYIVALMLVAFGAALLITAAGSEVEPSATVLVGRS